MNQPPHAMVACGQQQRADVDVPDDPGTATSQCRKIDQIEDTDGAVSAAGGLAMLRVITGISIMYFLVPGYLIAIALSFFVPRTFTAIAFDSGGSSWLPLFP